MQEISAGIIIYRKTPEGPKFLILYHGNHYWNFPKGKIEAEEKSFQTALREVREETGLGSHDLKLNTHFKTYEKFTFWRKSGKVYKTVVFYLAETRRKGIRISEMKEGQPHEGFAWFTYKEAMTILRKHKDSQRILTQAYEVLQGAKRSLHPTGRNGAPNTESGLTTPRTTRHEPVHPQSPRGRFPHSQRPHPHVSRGGAPRRQSPSVPGSRNHSLEKLPS